jgi:hypothetical protein
VRVTNAPFWRSGHDLGQAYRRGSGVEQITEASIEALAHVPLSRRRGAPQREALL